LVTGSAFLVMIGFFQLREPLPPRLIMVDREDVSDSYPYYKEESDSFPSKILKPLTQSISNFPYFRNLTRQAAALRINLNIGRMILLKFFIAILAGILVSVLISSHYALIAAMIGFFLPDFILGNKIRTKKYAITKVFPETLDLLDLCIGAGLDFTSAIQWVMEKTEINPFIEQLGVVLKEIRVGKNRSQALKEMAERLRLSEVSSFVRTAIQAERMGTSIEEALRNLSGDTREMRFQIGERYAIKASLKILFPLLFCILPVILIVVAGPIIIKFTQGGLFPTGTF